MYKKSILITMYEVESENKLFTAQGLEEHILFRDKVEIIKEHEKSNCFIRLASGKMYLVNMSADLLRKKIESEEPTQF
jgi:hypothetical protein